MSGFMKYYEIPRLARIFHSFPHINASLQAVDSTFDPDGPSPPSEIYLIEYLQSLGILACLPLACLILTLLVLLTYLVSRCCNRKPKQSTWLKRSLSHLALLGCVAAILGLSGNVFMHNGFKQILMTWKETNDAFLTIRNQIGGFKHEFQQTYHLSLSFWDEVEKVALARTYAPSRSETKNNDTEMMLNALAHTQYLSQTVKDGLKKLITSDPKLLSLRFTYKDKIANNIHNASTYVSNFENVFTGINFTREIEGFEQTELYRLFFTIAIVSVSLVLCIRPLISLRYHSRCILIMISVFSLFSVIISGLMTTLYLPLAVFIGDICVSPNATLTQLLIGNLYREFVPCYLHCDDTCNNTYNALDRGEDTVNIIQRELTTLTGSLDDTLGWKLHETKESIENIQYGLSTLSTRAHCSSFSRHLLRATEGLCHSGLYGLTLMLLASILTGLVSTLIVLIHSNTWSRLRIRDESIIGSGPNGYDQSFAKSQKLCSSGQTEHTPEYGHQPDSLKVESDIFKYLPVHTYMPRKCNEGEKLISK